MANKLKHPAKYADSFLPAFAGMLKGCEKVYDPFGGTGKLARIKDHGFSGKVYCCEIEPEWTSIEPDVDTWFIDDCAKTDYIQDNYFDAICTSPTYGNRMADHFNSKDKSHRITYKHYLGRDLNAENTGRMQWGNKYQAKHLECYAELRRVLKETGVFILNMSDHIRQGELVKVVDWHKSVLMEMGFIVIEDLKVPTPRMGFGKNGKSRVDHERIVTFRDSGYKLQPTNF